MLGFGSGSWDLDHIPARTDEGQEFGMEGRDVALAMDFNGSILNLKIPFGLKSFAEWGPLCWSYHLSSIILWTGVVFRRNEMEVTKRFLEGLRAVIR